MPTKIVTAQIGQLLEFYGVTPEVRVEALQLWGEVREQAKAAQLQGSSKGFWLAYADQYAPHYSHFLRLEAAASKVVTHQLVLIPGLLQTSDYRRAVARIDNSELSIVDIERRVELTARRQARLDADLRMDVLISEAVLMHRAGPPEVMRGQMTRLVEAGERDNISIRIVPLRQVGHRGLHIQSFTMLEFPRLESGLDDPPVVYLEGVVGALYHERVDVIEKYRQAISALQAVALTEEDTRDMVIEYTKEYAL
ncbi:DUF5753 domain-containing protein [Nocardia sp.]|uniref:DUF5753 domain-containing protein n=1 Tax=Nocardia sp. TaxID=1821 RepID=UPI002607F761|nr:DUF5753 domain-containing protein [Nocardia sp.]